MNIISKGDLKYHAPKTGRDISRDRNYFSRDGLGWANSPLGWQRYPLYGMLHFI